MRCERVLRRLDCLRTGELSPDEIACCERHLALCPPCRESLADLESLAANARSLMGSVPGSCLETVKDAIGDFYDMASTPLGDLWVAFSRQGIKRIAMAPDGETELVQEYRLESGRELERRALPAELASQVLAATQGRGLSAPAVDLGEVADFRSRVLEVLSSIPRGQVRTYAWVAREAGSPRAVRAVGSACASNPVPFLVPCHRVVPAAGGTGHYAYGAQLKRDMLRREGVPLERLDQLAQRGVRYIGYVEDGANREYCFPTCASTLDLEDESIVLLHSEKEAAALGLRPCSHCRPLAA